MNHNDDMQPEPWVLPHMLPTGCDQQGRHPTRPIPAEACTELGADDEPDLSAAGQFWTLYLAIVLVVLAAVMAWLG